MTRMALYLLPLPNSAGHYSSSQKAVGLENYLTLSGKQGAKKKQAFCPEKSYTYGAHCLSKFVLVHQPNDNSSIPVLTGRKEQHGH